MKIMREPYKSYKTIRYEIKLGRFILKEYE